MFWIHLFLGFGINIYCTLFFSTLISQTPNFVAEFGSFGNPCLLESGFGCSFSDGAVSLIFLFEHLPPSEFVFDWANGITRIFPPPQFFSHGHSGLNVTLSPGISRVDVPVEPHYNISIANCLHPNQSSLDPSSGDPHPWDSFRQLCAVSPQDLRPECFRRETVGCVV